MSVKGFIKFGASDGYADPQPIELDGEFDGSFGEMDKKVIARNLQDLVDYFNEYFTGDNSIEQFNSALEESYNDRRYISVLLPQHYRLSVFYTPDDVETMSFARGVEGMNEASSSCYDPHGYSYIAYIAATPNEYSDEHHVGQLEFEFSKCRVRLTITIDMDAATGEVTGINWSDGEVVKVTSSEPVAVNSIMFWYPAYNTVIAELPPYPTDNGVYQLMLNRVNGSTTLYWNKMQTS